MSSRKSTNLRSNPTSTSGLERSRPRPTDQGSTAFLRAWKQLLNSMSHKRRLGRAVTPGRKHVCSYRRSVRAARAGQADVSYGFCSLAPIGDG